MTEAIKRTQGDVGSLEAGTHRFATGLYLQVKGSNARSWVYRYSLAGKTRYLGLGAARDVTLAQARKRVDELRVTKIAKGIDPLAEEAAAAEQARTARKKAVPFQEWAERFFREHEQVWGNAKHRAQWRSTLTTYAYPIIGAVPAHEVTVAHIVDILRPVWSEKHDTARKVRGRIETILDYASDPDNPSYRNPAAKTAQLMKKLPKLGNRPKEHHPSLPYGEIADFMEALRQRDGTAALALEFTILTAARTGEVIGARWQEIDLRKKEWTVPAERMKGKREHRVPLSAAALSVLKAAKLAANGGIIFPSIPYDRPLSNMAMLTVLKRMGRADITVHGFRSTFKDWARERTNFQNEVSELALAHLVGDETERAYARGNMFEKRRRLMDAWAGYCGPRNGGNVVPLTTIL